MTNVREVNFDQEGAFVSHEFQQFLESNGATPRQKRAGRPQKNALALVDALHFQIFARWEVAEQVNKAPMSSPRACKCGMRSQRKQD